MKKKILMILAIISIITVLLFANQNLVNGASTVTSEKIVTSTNGSVDYIIKGLKLEDGANYQWAIEKSKSATIANWYDVTAPEYSTGNIKITISVENENQLAILKSTDTAYVTVRKVGETANILEGYQIDLTLPLLKAFLVSKDTWYHNGPNNPSYDITTVYGIGASNVSFKWEKITDANIVNSYIDNNHDLSGLKLKGKESFPSLSDTSWKSAHSDALAGITIKNNEEPTENGLYYLWLKGSSTDVKTIYGQAIIEVGEVTKIQSGNSNGNSGGTSNNTSNGSSTEKTNKTGNSSSGNQKDATTATKILPNTGKEIVIGSILILGIITIIVHMKCKKYKDIK